MSNPRLARPTQFPPLPSVLMVYERDPVDISKTHLSQYDRSITRLAQAYRAVSRLYLNSGLIDDLIRGVSEIMVIKGLAYWTLDHTEQMAYVYFGGYLDEDTQLMHFPRIILDGRIDDVNSFGFHSRDTTGLLSVAVVQTLKLNFQLVVNAEAQPENEIPVVKLINTISHELAHAFLSWCFHLAGIRDEQACTPPEYNYLHRYEAVAGAQPEGELGFWLDNLLWGGALFYTELSQHVNGHPSIFKKHETQNPGNWYVKLSDRMISAIAGLGREGEFNAPRILPVTYFNNHGELLEDLGGYYREEDGGIPRWLRPLRRPGPGDVNY